MQPENYLKIRLIKFTDSPVGIHWGQMEDWAEQCRQMLTRSGVNVLLLACYVDDGRQGTTTINKGYRFSKSDNIFPFLEESLAEDQKL